MGIIILSTIVGNIMSHVEQPEYTQVTMDGNIEIRDYPPIILAEVEICGQRKQAISEGFRILADYIFGNNTSTKKMDMTVPQPIEEGEKMAMTAPVLQQQHMDKWKVKFVMPKKYSLESLPRPNSKDIILIQMPATRFVVIRFAGVADDESIKLHTAQLEAYILAKKMKPIGQPIFGFYNRPSTLPFLRRNEVMIEIEDVSTIHSKFMETHQ